MQNTPTNPYLATAFGLAGATLAIGGILLLVGWQASASSSSTLGASLAGVGQTVLGGQFVTVGFIGLLIALAAGAITWRPAVKPAPEPIDPDSL